MDQEKCVVSQTDELKVLKLKETTETGLLAADGVTEQEEKNGEQKRTRWRSSFRDCINFCSKKCGKAQCLDQMKRG